MRTIFDNETAKELIQRVHSLSEKDQPRWGKMDLYQMLKHCVMSEEMFQGKKAYKRVFIGKLLGRMVLNGILKDEKPMKQKQPTHPDLKITSTGNWEEERNKWVQLLQGYVHYSSSSFMHPFFGKMTKEEVGRFVYKHTDHHLRQFGQ